VIPRVLLGGLALLGLAAVAVAVTGFILYTAARTSTVGKLTFESELAIPPLLAPRHGGGREVFELTLQRGRAAVLPADLPQ
jgi:hypothetical protein